MIAPISPKSIEDVERMPGIRQRRKYKLSRAILRTITSLLATAGLVAMLLVAGCSATVESTPQAAKDVQSGATLPAAVTGDGADASKLQPGPEGGAALAYINPNVHWSNYTKIHLLPVEFWAGADTKVSPADQQTLSTYFFNALQTELKKNFTLVDGPGPDVLNLRVALMDATTATPGLRSASVVIPQLKIINMAQSLATGSYAFVGSAEAEMAATDSTTGELLAGAVDKREGGAGLQGATSFKWGNTQNAMDYWAQKMSNRLLELQGRSAKS